MLKSLSLAVLALGLAIPANISPIENSILPPADEAYVFSAGVKNQLSFIEKMTGDEENYGQTFLKAWLDSPDFYSFSSVLSEYTEDPAENVLTDAVVRELKDDFYKICLMGFDATTTIGTSCDGFRYLLDHFMPLKDSTNWMIELCQKGITTYEDKLDLFWTIKDCLGSVTDIVNEYLCAPSTGTYQYLRSYRERMIGNSEYLKTHNDYSDNKYCNFLNMEEFVAACVCQDAPTRLKNEVQLAKTVFDSYLYSTNFLSDTAADYETFGDDELGYVGIAYYLAKFDYLSELIEKDGNYIKFLNNNVGPSLYKILDLMEAVKYQDSPNIKILFGEIMEDVGNFMDYLLEEEEGITHILDSKTVTGYQDDLKMGRYLVSNEYKEWCKSTETAIENINIEVDGYIDSFETEKESYDTLSARVDSLVESSHVLECSIVNKENEIGKETFETTLLKDGLSAVQEKITTYRKMVDDRGEAKNINVGMIVLHVIFGVLFLAVLAGFIYFFTTSKKKKENA